MSRQKASSAVLAALCSLFFLYLFVDGESASPVRTCSSSCGEIRNISHPFRLKGDPKGCGERDYELDCEDNKAVLLIDSTKYYVKEISYSKKKIRVVDIGFVNVSCNLPKNSMPEDKLSRDYRFYDDLLPWASFVNCSKPIKDEKYTLVPCQTEIDSYVYVIYGSFNNRIYDVKESCAFVTTVPALNSKDLPHRSFTEIWKILQMGFELEWSIECRNCRLSGGDCNYLFDVTGCMKNDSSMIKSVILIGLQVTRVFLTVLFLLGRFVFAPICIYVFLIYKWRKTFVSTDAVEEFLRNQQPLAPTRYSYTDILGMTSHFSEKLGQGGFGSVFKGKLPIDRLIAVKMLDNSKSKGEDFISEVSTIGTIHHVNVVQLIGFCSEGSHRALVYEYMPNGSLDNYIFSKKGRSHSFSWEKLNEIALGIARGINYLHQGCDMCILHFDIKPHNILLDHNLIPKISDFGLAKFYPKDYDIVSVSNARGTRGYIAPELISRNFGVVSYKSDVYSFGMLLLEMAGGRKNVDEHAQNSSQVYFPIWVHEHLDQGQELGIENATETENGIARKLCMVGLWCIQMKPIDRPSMSKVVEMLEGSCDALQMPPKPFFSSPPRPLMPDNCSTSNSTEEQISIITELD